MTSALTLMVERGYGRVGLGDIAAHAGVSKATVYHYFSNKDDLLSRSVSHRMSEKHAAVEARLRRAGGSAARRLQMFLQEFWNLSTTRQAGLWQQRLAGELATDAPEAFAAWSRGLIQRWRFVERLIREGQRSGEFRRDADARVAARVVISALSHQALFHVHFGTARYAPYRPDRLFASIAKHFFQGIRTRP
jgi:AcrR family transcriptional regulator